MKKKIAIVMQSLGGGGTERVIINLIRNLNDQRFKIDLILFRDEDSYANLIPEGVNIIKVNSTRMRHSASDLISIFNTIQPDVILSTQRHIDILLLIIKNRIISEPKIIVRIANSPSKILENKSFIQKKISRLVFRTLYKRADKIIAQCKEMKEDVINTFNVDEKLITYVYNPIDIKFINKSITFDNPFNSDEINYLAVGRLSYQKGFDILLHSFSRVVELQPNARLTILGTGDQQKKLYTLSKELKIERNITFKGFVKNPYDYYKYCDVYVLSSRWEGFPNSLLEALACNAKVVATNCKSGPKEILLNNTYGELVEEGNINSIAQGMINASSGSNKSSDRAKSFDIEKIILEYEQVLLEK